MKENAKRILSLMLAFCLIVCIAPIAGIPEAAAADKLSGVYEGYYYAAQGQTGLTLTILSDDKGIFEFYNMPGRSNAKDGSYYVSITYNNGEIVLKGTEWIKHPSGYSYVTLKGTLNGFEYTGKVNSDSSWPFRLLKENQSQQELRESIFNGHRYQSFEENMTWKEAKAYCENQGGYLASVTTPEENTFISGLIANGSKLFYWIGGTDEESEGSWQWVSGEPWDYSEWSDAQPDDSDGSEEYIGILREETEYLKPNKWNDFPNDGGVENGKGGFICEWDEYSDGSQWATPELQEAARNNLIPDSLIGADMKKPITRGEFAAVAVRLYEQLNNARAVIAADAPFTDIANDVNRNEILKAYNISAVRGISSTKYAASDNLNREQLATMLCRVYKRTQWPEWTVEQDNKNEYALDIGGVTIFADDAQISGFAHQSVYFMVKHGILEGVGNNKFAPKNTTNNEAAIGYANATREQAIAISLRTLKNMK